MDEKLRLCAGPGFNRAPTLNNVLLVLEFPKDHSGRCRKPSREARTDGRRGIAGGLLSVRMGPGSPLVNPGPEQKIT